MRKFNGFKAFLLAFAVVALAGLAFGTNKASAATNDPITLPTMTWGDDKVAFGSTWEYDSVRDVIEITNTTSGAIGYYVYALKDSTPKENVAGTAVVKTSINASTTPGAITFVKSATVTKPTVSLANDKAIYLNIGLKSDITSTAKYTSVGPTITIAAHSFKKLTGALDSKFIFEGSTGAVLTATTTDAERNTTTVNPQDLEYSFDGSTWISNQTTPVTGGAIYAGATVADKKKVLKKLYVRVKGNDASNTTPATGKRPSKAVSVSVKAPAKAPSVKVDVKTSTIALKNGMDYQVVATGSALGICDTDLAAWTTILPTAKDSENAATTVSTDKFTPIKKFTAELTAEQKANFTKTKVQKLALKGILPATDEPDTTGYYIYYRKSATAAAPASLVASVYIPVVEAAPNVTSNSTAAATCTAITFDVSTATARALEYCIISKNEVDTVDASTIKWTKLDTRTKASTKPSNYSISGAEGLVKSEASKSKVANGDEIWVRYAGVATRNADRTTSYQLASQIKKFTISVITGEDSRGKEITGYHAIAK